MTKEEGAIDKPSPHGERRRNRGDRLPMKTLRPTSFDVAERAGVSQSTVSRALRNSPGVNAETRARVSAAARELGYDSCPMVGFDAEAVAKLINLPADYALSFMLAIGKQAKPVWPRGERLPNNEVIVSDRYPAT